jgi:RNA polymerase sigma factor (sigma-70 family)
MPTSSMNSVIEHLRRAVLGDGAGLADGELLGVFIERHDEAAFSALVKRHSPMIWGVCRRLLSHDDAEDAFQATFLVLVRKAASIMPREMVGNWLYGVAHQTALQARRAAARRMAREVQVTLMPDPEAVQQDQWPDVQPLLDQELSHLPDIYRAVIVLCDLEGRTRKEVARQLKVPEGTVGGRLARARAMLAKRLTQRGVALSGGALAAVLSEQAASAGAPNSVVVSTIKAATLFAAGKAAATGALSVKVVALTEGVLKAMMFTKLKTALAVLAVVLVVVGGGGATALLAGDEGGRVGYQPPGIANRVGPATVYPAPAVVSGHATRPGEVALDANGGRNNPYFYTPPDPTNINHLWELRKTGDYHMLLPKVGEGKLTLDANGGRNNPYFSKPDPTNINHLWKLTKNDALYLIVPKAAEVALDANGGKNNPYFSKIDATNINCLWELRKTGDDYMIVPLVRREEKPQGVTVPKGKVLWDLDLDSGKRINRAGEAHKELFLPVGVRQEIENIVRRGKLDGFDSLTTLDEIEKAVQEMKEKAKKKTP